jgi:hypothetical protein
VKPEALDSSIKALDDYFLRNGIAASAEIVPGPQCFRARFALPKPPPLVSLILDLGDDLPLGPALAQALVARADYAKLEILLLYNTRADERARSKLTRWAEEQPWARLLPLDGFLGAAERLNAAAGLARGKILGFPGRGVIPISADWLQEIVSRLCLPGVGAVGGRLLSGDNTVFHTGYLADAHKRLSLSFHGLAANEPGYFCWAKLARTVDALDELCLFTHAEQFVAASGFDAALPGTFAQDYCLRLREKGLRSVVTPFAEFALTVPPRLPGIQGNILADQDFAERWSTRLEPCHPGLLAIPDGWTLAWTEGKERG